MVTDKLPIIDLNWISDEQELLPRVKSILMDHDTFLLKNYANVEQLDEILFNLSHFELPERSQGFDSNFTGVLEVDNNIFLEQYIDNTDAQLQFNRQCTNANLNNLYARLFKIGLFFAQLCVRSVIPDNESRKYFDMSSDQYFSKITRYFYQDESTHEFPGGEVFEYPLSNTYLSCSSAGIITIFPQATNIKCKPSTVCSDDNVWITVNEADCLLLHTGSLLASLSNGMHTTSPLKICPQNNVTHLTIGPPLNTIVDHGTGDTLANLLFRQQIEDFPQVAQEFYPREGKQLQLSKSVEFCKRLFSTCDTVLSLSLMSRSSYAPIELHSIIPQLSNMMRKKITQDDFLKMAYLWSECYLLEYNSKGDLTVGLPRTNVLSPLVNKSRRSDYSVKADIWFQKAINQETVPVDVPAIRVAKRKDNFNIGINGIITKQPSLSKKLPKEKRYISNPKEKFMTLGQKSDSQSNLLNRLRERERNSSALLSQKQKQYQQFLTVKMKHVFEILYSLPWNRPYTITYLTGLIVDSLQDSNNPIGISEAKEILEKLQMLLSNEISSQTVDGGLKVFRWAHLNKPSFSNKIDSISREDC